MSSISTDSTSTSGTPTRGTRDGAQPTGAAPVPGAVLAGIQAELPALQPSERRVAEAILDRPDWAIECSAADIAVVARVSRATVVRTAQRLGYTGLPQLRVLLARDLGHARTASDDSDPAAGPMRVVSDFCRSVAESVELLTALLDPADVERAVQLLAKARHILVGGNGVSAPVAAEAAMRLSSIGQPAEAPPDSLHQEIKARLLDPVDVCLVVSGTGATRSTLQVARAARAAGVPVVVVTAFSSSPLTALADITLTAGMSTSSFQDELRTPLRIPQTILINALVHAVAAHAPEAATAAHDRVLEVVGELLVEPQEPSPRPPRSADS